MSEDQEKEPVSQKAKTFFQDVKAEFHKITWPRGKELVETTKMVTLFIVVLAAFVWVCDVVLGWAIRSVMSM